MLSSCKVTFIADLPWKKYTLYSQRIRVLPFLIPIPQQRVHHAIRGRYDRGAEALLGALSALDLLQSRRAKSSYARESNP